MPIKNYVCNSLISGVNALKNIETSKAVLASDGDRAFVVDSGQYYYFRFYATSTEAEELVVHPFVVRPDYYVDAGVWIEQSLLSTDIMAILAEIYNDVAKEAKQLPDNHQVTVSNPTDISNLATSAKQLPDNHKVEVSNPVDVSGIAKEATLLALKAELEKKTEPDEIQMSDLIIMLRNMLFALTNSPFVDRAAAASRITVVNGTVTTVSTVSNLANIGSYQSDHLQRMDNMTAWATNTRRLIE